MPLGLRRLGDEPLTIACVYRSGGRQYTTRYVEVLRNMVSRNLTLPHRFDCLTAVEDVPCERIPLVMGWPGFFSKIELFRPGLFRGPVLYFDLDTVIHRNIDHLARLAGSLVFGCVSDPAGGHMNSSIQAFTVDCSFIFERFRRTGFFEQRVRPQMWLVLRHIGLEGFAKVGSSYGDQGFSEMCLAERNVPLVHVDHALPGAFSTFKYNAAADREPEG
ncbi:MAG: hypothetical protein IT538_02430, partial [Variibacter sp.]|nr:hypothetical protein [Variibacter sp.]